MSAPRAIARVRQADPTRDVDAVERLFLDLGYPLAGPRIRAWLEHHHDSDTDFADVAIIGSEVAGLTMTSRLPMPPLDRFIDRVTAVVVAEGARRQGAASALLNNIHKRAVAADCAYIELTSRRVDARLAAHDFYAQLGYVDTSDESARYQFMISDS